MCVVIIFWVTCLERSQEAFLLSRVVAGRPGRLGVVEGLPRAAGEELAVGVGGAQLVLQRAQPALDLPAQLCVRRLAARLPTRARKQRYARVSAVRT